MRTPPLFFFYACVTPSCQVSLEFLHILIIFLFIPYKCSHSIFNEQSSPPPMQWAVRVGCVLSLDILLASGGRPPGINPLRRGWVYRPAPEAPFFFFFKGKADGLVWAPVGGTEDKYHPRPLLNYKTSKKMSVIVTNRCRLFAF